MDEKTVVQRGRITCPEVTQLVEELDFKPRKAVFPNIIQPYFLRPLHVPDTVLGTEDMQRPKPSPYFCEVYIVRCFLNKCTVNTYSMSK